MCASCEYYKLSLIVSQSVGCVCCVHIVPEREQGTRQQNCNSLRPICVSVAPTEWTWHSRYYSPYSREAASSRWMCARRRENAVKANETEKDREIERMKQNAKETDIQIDCLQFAEFFTRCTHISERARTHAYIFLRLLQNYFRMCKINNIARKRNFVVREPRSVGKAKYI